MGRLGLIRKGNYIIKSNIPIGNAIKYHVFAPMGRFELELILLCLYFPPSFHQAVVVSVL